MPFHKRVPSPFTTLLNLIVHRILNQNSLQEMIVQKGTAGLCIVFGIVKPQL